tara:strand:+ start:277 stop:384 length:108 start_codon:yes stop_codon:yes gene_type:complete
MNLHNFEGQNVRSSHGASSGPGPISKLTKKELDAI